MHRPCAPAHQTGFRGRPADVLPSIDAFWRAATIGDLPALEDLQAACNARSLTHRERTDFRRLLTPRPDVSTATVCAAVAAPSGGWSGNILAFASAIVYSTPDEHRGDLEILVHPSLRDRGIDAFLLSRAETRARRLLAARSPDRPSLLRLAFTDHRDDTLYPRHGFRHAHSTATMRRDLHAPLPPLRSARGVELLPWHETRAHALYALYLGAFQARPRFVPLSPVAWRQALIEPAAFRPDLSLLLRYNGLPAGYLICWLDQEKNAGRHRTEGFLAQVGVAPHYRRQGFASMLFAAALHAYRALGLDDAVLTVRTDNLPALSLYHQLGFREVARLTVYHKPLTPPLPCVGERTGR